MKQLNTKKLTFLALMVALQIVFARTLGIELGNYQRISFSFIPVTLASTVAGPVASGIASMVADILGFITKPTGPYFPGFTLNAFLSAFIYGIFFYKKKLTLKRIIIANVLVTGIVGCLMGTYWLHLLYGNPFVPVLMTKLPFQGLMLVIKIVVQALILERLSKETIRLFGN
ncbi:MAG: folate family ECF transporter S component [Peptoniphilus sp.]|nr:folate family ECF transporter S component [Peptoniphilus sp.]MDD7363250.1 folate family ECF transporter S component [Bacillota bacterium]MDY6045343.1 folate family ECF transporter S component [Peptoniphilus sp.]